MPPQISHGLEEMSAFNALDVKLIQHKAFVPALYGAKSEGSWVSCFQVTKEIPISCPADPQDSEVVEANQNVTVTIVQKDSDSVDNADDAQFKTADYSSINGSVDSPKRSDSSPSPVSTPPTASKNSTGSAVNSACQSLGFDCCSWASELIVMNKTAAADTVNSAASKENLNATNRQAVLIVDSHEDEDKLDELMSAAEILYSCRNVEHQEPFQGQRKRRRMGSGRMNPSRKLSDQCLSDCTPSNTPTNTPTASDRRIPAAQFSTSDVSIPRLTVPQPRVQSKRAHAASNGASQAGIPNWAIQAMTYLQNHGQDLLSSICAHYRIEYTGDLCSLKDYSLEQLAHNAIFNPALPKANHGLPMMLRDVKGVTDFRMSFVKDDSGTTRGVHVTARLDGEAFIAECRACSYCGSCFSGRFMKPNAVHQQAGGWKEITHRTAAGKFSWAPLIGRRLCVPCFTHWAANGTNVNANRPSIDDTARLLVSTQPALHLPSQHQDDALSAPPSHMPPCPASPMAS